MTPDQDAAKTSHDLTVRVGQHPPDVTIYEGWKTGRTSGLTMLENFANLEEWRPGTQELREAVHNFLIQNEDINKIQISMKEFR